MDYSLYYSNYPRPIGTVLCWCEMLRLKLATGTTADYIASAVFGSFRIHFQSTNAVAVVGYGVIVVGMKGNKK